MCYRVRDTSTKWRCDQDWDEERWGITRQKKRPPAQASTALRVAFCLLRRSLAFCSNVFRSQRKKNSHGQSAVSCSPSGCESRHGLSSSKTPTRGTRVPFTRLRTRFSLRACPASVMKFRVISLHKKREEKRREKTAQKLTAQQAAEVWEMLESDKDPYKNAVCLFDGSR